MIFFFYFAGTGSITPFLNLIFQQKGIPLEQISILAAITMGMGLLATPIWAGLADVFNLHKRLLPFLMLMSIPFLVLIAISNSFLIILLIVLLFAFCYSPLLTLVDNAILLFLNDKRYLYGRSRLWGSIGWGLIGWVMGILMKPFGVNITYVGYIVFILVSAGLSLKLPELERISSTSYWQDMRKLSQERRWYSFLAAALLAGAGMAMITAYLIIYLKELGASSSLQGLSVAIMVVLELPFFFFSSQLLKRYSKTSLIQIGMVMLIARLLLLSFLRDPIMVVAVQLLHGPYLSLFWTAGVNYASDLAPPGLSASAQGLLGAVFFGMAGILGSFGGGMLFARLGAANMFLVGAIAGLLGLIIFSWPRKTPAQ
jgi:MFS family permease